VTSGSRQIGAAYGDVRQAVRVVGQRLPPTREEIDEWFAAVLAGTRTRDEADRWAAQWHANPADHVVANEASWWALERLHGIDLPDLDGRFLHDDEQVEQWLEEFPKPPHRHTGPTTTGPRAPINDLVLPVCSTCQTQNDPLPAIRWRAILPAYIDGGRYWD
jgi:hypothetical protein